MTAPSQAESLKWAVCPSKFEDLRSARFFGTRDASIEFFNSAAKVSGWLAPLPVVSVLDYPKSSSPRPHLSASAFPMEVARPLSLLLVENPPEWTDSKFQGRGLLHNATSAPISVPLPDELDPGETIEYGRDLEGEIALAIALPDCCLSKDSLAHEVENVALQLPGNDLTRKRASVREYFVAALVAYDDALLRIWPRLSAEAFAKWIRSYQFQQYLHRLCDRLMRAVPIQQLVTATGLRSEIERVRVALGTEIARLALSLGPEVVSPPSFRRRGRTADRERNGRIASILNGVPDWESHIDQVLLELDAAVPKISAPATKSIGHSSKREPYESWEEYGQDRDERDIKRALRHYLNNG